MRKELIYFKRISIFYVKNVSVSDVFLHRRILLAMTTLCLLIKVYVPLYIAWNVLMKSTWLNKRFEKFENVNFILLQHILKFSNLGFSEKDFIMETSIWWINLWTVKWWKSESPEIYFGILMPRAIRQFTKKIVYSHYLESTTVIVCLQYLYR